MTEYNTFDKPIDTETSRSFSAFCVYRDLGIGRTVLKAYLQERPVKDQSRAIRKAPPKYYTVWATANHWVARAKAYDVHLSTLARKQREKEHLEDLAEFRKVLRTASRATLNNGIMIQNKVSKRMQAMSDDEAIKIKPSVLSTLLRAGNDSIEKGMDGWGAALGVDDLLDMLEDIEGDE